MSLEAIKNKILAEGGQKAEAILSSARREAEKILASAEAQARKLEEDILRQAEQKIQTLESSTDIEIQMHSQQAVLQAKHKLRDQVLREAMEKVAQWPEPDYGRFLEALVREIPADFRGQSARVPRSWQKFSSQILSQHRPELVGEKIAADDRLSGGFYLTGASFDLDFTLTSILTPLMDKQAESINQILFGDKR